jgi:hypothetical protein
VFSVPELKRLQTFPDDYEIVGGRQVAIHQIGTYQAFLQLVLCGHGSWLSLARFGVSILVSLCWTGGENDSPRPRRYGQFSSLVTANL